MLLSSRVLFSVRDLLSILKPKQPLLTSPNLIRSFIIPNTVTEGIASPIPSDPPELLRIKVFIPTSLPDVSISAPPEFPLLIEASV